MSFGDFLIELVYAELCFVELGCVGAALALFLMAWVEAMMEF